MKLVSVSIYLLILNLLLFKANSGSKSRLAEIIDHIIHKLDFFDLLDPPDEPNVRPFYLFKSQVPSQVLQPTLQDDNFPKSEGGPGPGSPNILQNSKINKTLIYRQPTIQSNPTNNIVVHIGLGRSSSLHTVPNLVENTTLWNNESTSPTPAPPPSPPPPSPPPPPPFPPTPPSPTPIAFSDEAIRSSEVREV